MQRVAIDPGRAAFERDAPLHQAIEPVRHLQGLADILLDDDQRRAGALDFRNGGVDVANDDPGRYTIGP